MRHAFTLIEALIAVALSAIVVAMLFAGIRLASGCVATADRLAVQNRMITAGMLALSDELDAWTSYDDPLDPGRQPLRSGLDGAGRSAPFSPMDAAGGPGAIASAWGDGEYEWSVAEPKSWWRGCMAERCEGDWRSKQPRFGYYGVSGAAVPSGQTPSYANYGAPPQPTTDGGAWLYDQEKRLYHALGFYGMADYLPANAIFGWYEDPAIPPQPHPWPTPSGLPCYFLIASSPWPGQQYNRAGGASPTPQSLYQATYNGIFALTAGTAASASANLPDLIDRNRYAWMTWEGMEENALRADVRDVFAKAEARSTLLPLQPAHWPGVAVRLLRSVHKAYFTNLCTVAWIDAQTGESSELRYTGFGTTLRGARRGRGLDAP